MKNKITRLGGNYFLVENDIFNTDLDKHSKLIYMALCRFSDNQGVTYPSMTKIADMCGISRSTVDKYLEPLLENGIVKKYKEKKYNVYEMQKWTCTPDGTICIADDKSCTRDGHEPVRETDTKKTNTKKTNNKYSPKWTEEDTEYQLTMYLKNLIDKNNVYSKSPEPKTKRFDNWVTEIDRLMRLDGVTNVTHIKQTMKWCQQDNFWKNNILSAGKFRDKFPQLFVKAKNDGFVKESFSMDSGNQSDDSVEEIKVMEY